MSAIFASSGNTSSLISGTGAPFNTLGTNWSFVLWLGCDTAVDYIFAELNDGAPSPHGFQLDAYYGMRFRRQTSTVVSNCVISFDDSYSTASYSWKPIIITADGPSVTWTNGTNEDIFDDIFADPFSWVDGNVNDIALRLGYQLETRGRIAEVALFDYTLSNAQRTLAVTNTPNNLGGTPPIAYWPLESDAAAVLGGANAALTDLNGDVTFDGVDHPSLTGPTPVNPVFSDGPNATQIADTAVVLTGTSTESCAVQVVATQSATVPDDATFNATAFTNDAIAGAPFSIPVTGLTALTGYYLHARLKPAAGNNHTAYAQFTTTPTAPVITSVNSGNPIANLTTYIVVGSGFTGHTAADIDGTVQAGFTVDSDTQVTITAVRPNTLRYGQNATFNISGTTTSVTMAPQANWGYVEITSIASNGIIGTTPPLKVGDQVSYEVVNGSHVLDDGTAAAASVPATFEVGVHDGVSWGSSGDITLGVVTNVGSNLADRNKNYFNGLGYTHSMNDNIQLHLRNLGYTGSVPDMLRQKADAEGFDSINEMMREQGYEPQ